MVDLKKTWIKPLLINLNQSTVAGGGIPQAGHEGAKFLNGFGCGVSGTVFAKNTFATTPTFNSCKMTGCNTMTIGFYGASSDTDFLVFADTGLCS